MCSFIWLQLGIRRPMCTCASRPHRVIQITLLESARPRLVERQPRGSAPVMKQLRLVERSPRDDTAPLYKHLVGFGTSASWGTLHVGVVENNFWIITESLHVKWRCYYRDSAPWIQVAIYSASWTGFYPTRPLLVLPREPGLMQRGIRP